MKTTTSVLLPVLMVGCVLTLNVKLYGTVRHSDFASVLEVASFDHSTGRVDIQVGAEWFSASEPTWDSLSVTVYTRRGLDCIGDTAWTVSLAGRRRYFKTLSCAPPRNDTSVLVVLFEFGRHGYARYRGIRFLISDDKLVKLPANPLDWSEMSVRRASRLKPEISREDYKRARERYEEQTHLPSSEGKVWTGIPIAPEDSAWAATLSDTDKRKLAKMRWLERKPLTEYDSQSMLIGGEYYIRFRGQKKFHHQQKRTREQMRADYKRFRDSLAAHPPNTIYDVVLDLRKAEDLDFVRSLVDSLIPTDSAGFYRAIMKHPPLIKIEKRGIRIIATHNWPPRGRRGSTGREK